VSSQKLIQPPIEPGEYRLRYIRHQRTSYRGTPKLSIEFEIDTGEHQGRIVRRHYNVEETEDGWSAPANGHLAREFVSLFATVTDLQKLSLDDLPIELFRGRVIVGLIEMSAQDADKQPIHKLIQTPVVRKLVRLEVGDENLSSPCLTSPSLPSPPPLASLHQLQHTEAPPHA